MQHVAVEALIVGAIFLVVLMAVHGAGEMMLVNKLLLGKPAMYTPQTHTEYMMRIAALAFVSGVAAHLILEAVGLNKMYCSVGAACSK